METNFSWLKPTIPLVMIPTIVGIILNTLATVSQAISPDEVQQHIEMGNLLLANGQYADALSHLHTAIEGDPNNYMSHYKRATVYLAMGRAKPATDDLDRVIELKPDFAAARFQRGTLLLKQGRLDEAHIDFEWVLRLQPDSHEAISAFHAIEPIRQDMELAHRLVQDRMYDPALSVLSKLIQDVPWSHRLREVRAQCFEAVGDRESAITDLRAATRLHKDNTDSFLKLSRLSYQLADLEDALNSVRECLKMDPDHKACFSHYKSLRKVSKDLDTIKRLAAESDFPACVTKAQAAAASKESLPPLVAFQIKSKLCFCQLKNGDADAAVSSCTEALNLSPNAHTYCDRAEAHIALENFEDALRDYQEAAHLEPELQRAQSGIQRTQKLIKQSKKRDYYKILGVKRTANKKEITRAYRKLAQKWHPDNFRGDEKKAAEKKFIDIASAKEVLTDPEKRQKFDNGEDPLDPEAQTHHQGFHPFGHGFQAPFAFKFTFT